MSGDSHAIHGVLEDAMTANKNYRTALLTHIASLEAELKLVDNLIVREYAFAIPSSLTFDSLCRKEQNPI
jgi:hypothetical protein